MGRPHGIRRYGCLLGRFAEGGCQRRLGRRARATRQCPRAALVAPDCTMLHEYPPVVDEHEAGRTIAAPVPLAARTVDPAVAVGAVRAAQLTPLGGSRSAGRRAEAGTTGAGTRPGRRP